MKRNAENTRFQLQMRQYMFYVFIVLIILGILAFKFLL